MKQQTAHGHQIHIAQADDEVRYGDLRIAFCDDGSVLVYIPGPERGLDKSMHVAPVNRDEIKVRVEVKS